MKKASISVLTGVNFLIALFLERKLTTFAAQEITLIFLGFFVFLIALIGMAMEEKWGWTSLSLLNIGVVANIIYLYMQTRITWIFIIGLILALASLLISTTGRPKEEEQLEVYNDEEEKPKKRTKK